MNDGNPELFFDLDGCINAGPEQGGGTSFPKIPPFDLAPELPTLSAFLEFRRAYGLSCHAVTGRSVKISKTLLRLLTNAPSVAEHGTIIYCPKGIPKEKHLIEVDDRYAYLEEAVKVLELFIASAAPNWIAELQRHFPRYKLRMLLDNAHIWTIEISPPDLRLAERLRVFINERVLPPQMIRHIKNGHLGELVSSGAYDLMPAVSKRVALESLIRLHGIDVSTSLGIGDSFHSDDWLSTILEGGGMIGCPANADEQLKQLVRAAGKRGLVASQSYFAGSRQILEHFIGPFP